jgi:hypothetical protein
LSAEERSNDRKQRALLGKAPQPPPSKDAEQHRTELDAGTAASREAARVKI